MMALVIGGVIAPMTGVSQGCGSRGPYLHLDGNKMLLAKQLRERTQAVLGGMLMQWRVVF
jgi:hypothetical protein